jgi:hypothetical protein
MTRAELDTVAPRHGFWFSISNTTSFSSTNINLLISNIIFYIIKANTLFLLSLADIIRLRIYFNNVLQELVRDGSIS